MRTTSELKLRYQTILDFTSVSQERGSKATVGTGSAFNKGFNFLSAQTKYVKQGTPGFILNPPVFSCMCVKKKKISDFGDHRARMADQISPAVTNSKDLSVRRYDEAVKGEQKNKHGRR